MTLAEKVKAEAVEERVTAVQVAVELTMLKNGLVARRREERILAMECDIPQDVLRWIRGRLSSDAT